MLSLEQELLTHFRQHGIAFHQHVSGETRFVRLDFGFGDSGQKRYFSFDAKEKRQRYNLRNWPNAGIDEEHLFIIDDLAARRVLAFAPNSGLLIRDNGRGLYFLFTVVDLFLMPKLRVNRRLDLNPPLLKGKWLIDLRNGQSCPDLAAVFARIEAYLDQRETIFSKELACFGAYVGETISAGGVARQPQHWERDIRETR